MSTRDFRFVVEGDGDRLDRVVAEATGRGRRTARRWIEGGRVRLDGRIAHAAAHAAAGSSVVIEGADCEAAPRDVDIVVVYDDADLVAVSKPASLNCERGLSPGSVAESLARLYGDLSTVGDRAEEGGLAHRLDRDTSGIVLAARHPAAYRALREAFASGRTRKHYLALANGALGRRIDVSLALTRRAGRMAVAGRHDQPLPARTRLEPLEAGEDWSLVLATMSTGVMHQVRVHMAAAGHPLLGDVRYGGPSAEPWRSGQLLHALRVQVGGSVDLSCAPPGDFLAALAALRRRTRATGVPASAFLAGGGAAAARTGRG